MKSLFAFLAAAGLVAAVFASGCGPASLCNANNCQGCCSQAGVCLRGLDQNSCGSAGNLCDVCSNIQTCQAGVCTSAAGGGSGGSGGSGGAGGAGGASGKRVFVTATTYTGNLAAAGAKTNGLDGADALCNTAAQAAALGGTWKAWVSDGTVRAVDRITGNGPWRKLDTGRTIVFNNKANLSTLPLAPINYNENGISVATTPGLALVWTGTANGGGNSSQGHCNGFTSAGLQSGETGDVASTTDWTARGARTCSEDHRLYCFEL
jgi:hypothetical protein